MICPKKRTSRVGRERKLLCQRRPSTAHLKIVNRVHPEPVTVTENTPELVEEVLKGSPSFLPPKEENKDTEKGTFFLAVKKWSGCDRPALTTQGETMMRTLDVYS